MAIKVTWERRANRNGTQPRQSRCRSFAAGFTAIELVAVIVVLTLLAAILLPAASQARERARTATCETNLLRFGAGMLIYANDNADWIPGVNTSGVATRAKNGVPGAMNPSAVPVQSFDWMTPVLQDDPNLPDNRAARFHYLYSEYRCPQQTREAILYPGGLNVSPDKADFLQYPTWPACSYLMPTYFSLWGSSHAGTILAHHEGDPGFAIYARVVPTSWEVGNDDYLSRVDQVGPPARKIFAADATRYVDSTGIVDIDVNPDLMYYGAFTGAGAWWAGSNEYGVRLGSLNWHGWPVARGNASLGLNLPISYRHGPGAPAEPQASPAAPVQAGGTPLEGTELGDDDIVSTQDGTAQGNHGFINAVFFDGHVERLNDRRSREIDLWYPTGSVVQTMTEGMTFVPNGTVIP